MGYARLQPSQKNHFTRELGPIGGNGLVFKLSQ